MIGHLPRRPTGLSQEARFWQWVWDNLSGRDRIEHASGRGVTRTTRGFYSK